MSTLCLLPWSCLALATGSARAQPAPSPAPPPAAPLPAPAATPGPPAEPPDAPLQFRIGRAYLTPVGFADLINVWRSKATGTGIGTNYGSIPYGGGFRDHLSESRLSMQNSRIGLRVDTRVDHAHVMAYLEADFLGATPGNVAVSTNSNSLRSRLYWVDVRDGALELLAGQTWSLITPGRSGISPLPGDIFYTQNVDVNYQAGLVLGRIPELRAVVHSKHVAFALALDSAEQYIGGSSGGGLVTLPAELAGLAGSQLDDGTSGLSVPNAQPDLIAKLAFDAGKRFHLELGGVERQFRIWDPRTEATARATGLGGFANLSLELFHGFRLVTNNYASQGGGRYLLGQAPDVIVTADGKLEPVRTGSTVSGLEWQLGDVLLYGYYGAVYIDRTDAPATGAAACTSATTCVGYGYPGAPVAQNKWIREETGGFSWTFWKHPAYGALNLMGQYAHVHRDPWQVPVGGNRDAHLQEVFLDLRYTLPGSAPTLGR